MDDPPVAMATFARQMERAILACERHAEIDQPCDCVRRMFDDMLDDFAIIQARSGDHRIVDVRVEAITFLEHRGDSALSASARAVAERALCDHRDLALFGEIEGSGETRRAGPDDQYIGVDAHAASMGAEVRLRNTSSRSGSRVDTSTMACPSAVSELSTCPAFTLSLR